LCCLITPVNSWEKGEHPSYSRAVHVSAALLRKEGKAKRAHHSSDDRVMVGTAHARLCPPCGAWGTHDTRESASFTRAKHLQLGNAIFGAVEPPTKLAALHHHHIRMNVGLVARVELSGRELVYSVR
jgi:hypothetical protein